MAVDSVGASVMGFDPANIRHLRLAADKGWGLWAPESIWARGNAIDEARRAFRRPDRPTAG